MLADFEIPVIETYTELAWVLATVACAAFLTFRLWRWARPRTASSKAHAKRSGTMTRYPKATAAALASDFDRLSTVVAGAGDRVLVIAEKHAAASMKLGSTEMAMDRLISEFASVRLRAASAKQSPPQGERQSMPLPAEHDQAA